MTEHIETNTTRTIWLVDDDISILEVTQMVLEEAGFSVVSILSVTELEKKLTVEQPDALFVDLHMSGTDGGDLTKKLKAHVHTRALPIVIISADPQLAQCARVAGADAYIQKPYDIYELVELAERCTQKS